MPGGDSAHRQHADAHSDQQPEGQGVDQADAHQLSIGPASWGGSVTAPAKSLHIRRTDWQPCRCRPTQRGPRAVRPTARRGLLPEPCANPGPLARVGPNRDVHDTDFQADHARQDHPRLVDLRAPPPPVRAAAASLAGGKLFEHARCSACHQPVMLTGPSPVRALAYQPVRLYSDLLLHDMGALGDGIEQDSAEAREMRTAPLWGAAGPTGFSARWPCVVGGPGDPAARSCHRPLAEPLQGAQAGRATAIAGVLQTL